MQARAALRTPSGVATARPAAPRRAALPRAVKQSISSIASPALQQKKSSMLAPSRLAPAAPARGPAPVLSTAPLVAAASVPATPPPFKWCVFGFRSGEREEGEGGD